MAEKKSEETRNKLRNFLCEEYNKICKSTPQGYGTSTASLLLSKLFDSYLVQLIEEVRTNSKPLRLCFVREQLIVNSHYARVYFGSKDIIDPIAREGHRADSSICFYNLWDRTSDIVDLRI